MSKRFSRSGLALLGIMSLTALLMGAPCNFDNSNAGGNPNPVSDPGSTAPTGTPDGTGSNTGSGDNTGGDGTVTGTVQTYTCFLFCNNGGSYQSAGCKDSIAADSQQAAENYAAAFAVCPSGQASASCEFPGSPCSQ